MGMSPLLSARSWGRGRGGAERVCKAGCSQEHGSRQERDGSPGSATLLQDWTAQLRSKGSYALLLLVKSVFLSPTFLQKTQPFLECIGLFCLTIKPHFSWTFFFLFILQLLCWSEEIDPVLFSHLGAFNWCWWWYFSIWQSTRWINYLPSSNFKAIHCTNCRSGQ